MDIVSGVHHPGRKTTNRLRAIETRIDEVLGLRLRHVARQLIAFGRLKPGFGLTGYCRPDSVARQLIAFGRLKLIWADLDRAGDHPVARQLIAFGRLKRAYSCPPGWPTGASQDN